MIDKNILKAVADAIEQAGCPGREGPYGLYDYSEYNGGIPPYQVRDFRKWDDSYGRVVFNSYDRDEAHTMYETLTREHIAKAAIQAYLTAMIEELSNGVDPNQNSRYNGL